MRNVTCGQLILLLIGAILVIAIVLVLRGLPAQGEGQQQNTPTPPPYVGPTNTTIPQYGITETPSGQVLTYTSTPVPMAPSTQTVGVARGQLFRSPVQATSWFNEESKWLIAEPGVLLDASTAWTIPGTNQTWSANVPEGGFTYFSMGGGTISVDGVSITLNFKNGLNYLVLIRGRIDDGIVDSDLNLTAQVSGFVPGHAIWSHMPTGAYVSKDWFRQQLVASTTGGFTNCGATGCSRVDVFLFDVDSHFFQQFETHSGAIDTWTLIASS